MEFKWTPELPKQNDSVTSSMFEAEKRTFQLAITKKDKVYMSIEYFGNSYVDIITQIKLMINGEDREYPYSFNKYNNVFTFAVPQSKFYTIAAAVHIHPNPYKSKEVSGYAGMRNLGATCYMNSYLQLLFHISGFSSNLFQLQPKRKTFQLQKLFYKLLKDDDIDTRSFVNNCRWFSDVFTHQDVHEFGKLVFDVIEEENMHKNDTKEEEEEKEQFFIDEMFQGVVNNYVAGACGCESPVKDKFYEIQLEIRDWLNNVIADNIEDGLKGLKNVEKLVGDNKYRCENHELVDAIKGSSIVKLPPVLTVLLKRFGVDLETGESKKINDFYAFSERISVDFDNRTGVEKKSNSSGTFSDDIKNFINDPSVDNDDFIHKQKNKKDYKLFGVVVHSGAVADGHYYCYLNIDGWYKFNDSVVMKVSEDEAIFDNFGGVHPYRECEKNYSAYLLVYVDENEWDKIIKQKVEIVKSVEDKILESESGKMISLNLITKKDIEGYKGTGIFNVNQSDYMRIRHSTPSARSDDTLFVLCKDTNKRNNYIYDALTFHPLSNDECVVEDKFYFLYSSLKKRHKTDILIFLKRYTHNTRCINEDDIGLELRNCCFVNQDTSDIEKVIDNMGLDEDHLFFIEERLNVDDQCLEPDILKGQSDSTLNHDNSSNIIHSAIDKMVEDENIVNKRFRSSDSKYGIFGIRPFNADLSFKDNNLVDGSILIACKPEEEDALKREYNDLLNRILIILQTSAGDINLYLNKNLTHSMLQDYIHGYFVSKNISISPFNGTLVENDIHMVKINNHEGTHLVQFGDGIFINNLNNIFHIHYLCLDDLSVKGLFQKISMLKCIKEKLNPHLDDKSIKPDGTVETNHTFNKIIYDKIKESFKIIEIVENSPYYTEYSIDDTIAGFGRMILKEKVDEKTITLIYHDGESFAGYPILLTINNITTLRELRLKYNILTRLCKYNGSKIEELQDDARIDSFTEIDVIINHGF